MTPNELIDKLGGTTAVARLLGIKAPSVHAWRTGGIPDDKLIRLAPFAEQRGIACRQDLFPNDWHLIWPELNCNSASVIVQHPQVPMRKAG